MSNDRKLEKIEWLDNIYTVKEKKYLKHIKESLEKSILHSSFRLSPDLEKELNYKAGQLTIVTALLNEEFIEEDEDETSSDE